jgi:tetratricopeptide (TPR) repeat protein
MVEIKMTTKCTLNRSIFAVAAVLAWSGSAMAAEQKPEVQRLFQSGSYEQAVEAARDGDPASTFLAAQSLVKLDRSDRAVAELTRLRASDNPSWRSIGESGEALIAGDAGRAVELARRAIEADGGNPFAQYQLGLAAAKAGDWGTAVDGFHKGRRIEAGLRVRALLRGAGVSAPAPVAEDRGTLRRVPAARAGCARALRGRRDSATIK